MTRPAPRATADPHAPPLAVGGLTPLTTVDFPGRLAAVVFCQGCPWRCRYCQNAHLIPPGAAAAPRWTDVLALLDRRRGLLDGVAFSGGEPTLQTSLPAALESVRGLGFATALHTAGPYPERLAEALPLLDWVGLDVKALPEAYPDLTGGGEPSGIRAWRSLESVLASGVAYEVRTTVHPDLLDTGDLERLARRLAALGVSDYVLQKCVASRCLDPSLGVPQRPDPIDTHLVERLSALFPRFSVRTA
jgi:pyruvate formate lyase activating enzyme